MPKRLVLLSFVTGSLLISVECLAATYYVRDGGNDSADGRSHANAWTSIDRVNSFSFASGDIVLFHEGHTWAGTQLEVDWGGTTASHAVVGAYYVTDGNPVRGFRTARPTIDGEDRIPTTSRYDSLIKVTGQRVRVENLALRNSEGRGITFAYSNYPQAAGLLINNTYDCAIAIIESSDGIIEHNHIIEADRAKPEGSPSWCSAISNVRSDRTIIRRNIVERSYGEGINSNYGSRGAIIEDNIVFGVRAVGIYADSVPDTTIRRNIVVGTRDSTYWRGGSTVGAGIALNNEPYSHVEGGGNLDSSVQTTNARVYGNLVAYASSGIAVWGDIPSSSFNNTIIVNNTLVDNVVQFRHYGKPMPSSVFANNILLSISDGTSDVEPARVTGLTTRNNYYSQGDPGGMYSHDGNRYTGLVLGKMSGWRDIDALEDVSAGDFAPAAVSTTNGAGNDAHLALADSEDAFHLDFNSRSHNDPMDLGGISFADPGPKRPKTPTHTQLQTN